MPKLLDRENGKILGINAFDLFVILIIFFLFFSLISRVIRPGEQVKEYSGLNIQNAALEFTRLSNYGFVVYSEIDGKWTVNGSKFEGTVLLVEALETRLIGKMDGRTVTIGGPNAYLEDLAAKKIIFRTDSPSLIRIRVKEPIIAKDLREFVESLRNISAKVAGKYGVKTLRVQTYSLVFEMPGFEATAVRYIEIKRKLAEYVPYPVQKIYVYDDFISISLYPTSLSIRDTDLLKLNQIFEELGLNYTRVMADQIEIYIGTKESLVGVGVYGEILANARPLSDIIDTTRLTFIPKP